MVIHFSQNMRTIDAHCETPFDAILFYFILFYKLRTFCCNASLIRNVIKCIYFEFYMTFFVLESVLKYRKE